MDVSPFPRCIFQVHQPLARLRLRTTWNLDSEKATGYPGYRWASKGEHPGYRWVDPGWLGRDGMPGYPGNLWMGPKKHKAVEKKDAPGEWSGSVELWGFYQPKWWSSGVVDFFQKSQALEKLRGAFDTFFFVENQGRDPKNGSKNPGTDFLGFQLICFLWSQWKEGCFFSYHLYEKSHQPLQASLRSSLGGKWFGTSLWSLSASSESALNCASGRGVSNGIGLRMTLEGTLRTSFTMEFINIRCIFILQTFFGAIQVIGCGMYGIYDLTIFTSLYIISLEPSRGQTNSLQPPWLGTW